MTVYRGHKGTYRYHFMKDGKRYTKSGFPTKKAARDAEADHQKSLQTAGKSAPETLALSSLMFEYLEANRRRLNPKTWSYKKFVFENFLAHAGDIPVLEVSPLVVDGYLQTRPSAYNANFHRKDLGALFNWGRKHGLCASNPALMVDKFQDDVRRREVPTPQEVAKIFLAAGKDRPFLKVVFYTLARKSEVLTMRWRDIDFKRREITLWTRKRRGGNLEPDQFPMHEELYKILADLWAGRVQDEWVFINPETGTRYMNRPKLMGGICKRAGVRHITLHQLRHYAASWLYDNGVSMKALQHLLRHQSIATTERYLHRMDGNLHDAISILPNPEEMAHG